MRGSIFLSKIWYNFKTKRERLRERLVPKCNTLILMSVISCQFGHTDASRKITFLYCSCHRCDFCISKEAQQGNSADHFTTICTRHKTVPNRCLLSTQTLAKYSLLKLMFSWFEEYVMLFCYFFHWLIGWMVQLVCLFVCLGNNLNYYCFNITQKPHETVLVGLLVGFFEKQS